ncbi:MAG: helix-turn-helix domain-containing protein [Acidobacteriia bacterium]|nr:helix-turn-helix domain-containing protein [Terriglobia bacterium]
MSQGPFYRTLGERVRRARLSARYSQGRLASCVGLSRSSVANIETGRQPVYIHALLRIAKQLRTPISDLIPPTDKELDAAESEDVKRLPEAERRFVNLILGRSSSDKKERDGSEILPGKKASGRSAKTRAGQTGADSH